MKVQAININGNKKQDKRKIFIEVINKQINKIIKKNFSLSFKFCFIQNSYLAAKYIKKQQIKIPGLSSPNSFKRVYLIKKKKIKIDDIKYKR